MIELVGTLVRRLLIRLLISPACCRTLYSFSSSPLDSKCFLDPSRVLDMRCFLTEAGFSWPRLISS